MRSLILALLLLPSLCLGQSARPSNNQVSIGTIETIHSTILEEDREVWVYVPKGAGGKTRYPVMYLLDGRDFFHSMSGIVAELGSVGRMPKMIVVGIINNDRGGDFTPTRSMFSRDGMVDPDFRNSGRGEKFLSFVQGELMPYIESRYNTEPYRMLVGHSLGALAVLHALVNHPSLFNSYVAIDPSVWWDNHLIAKQAQKTLTQKDYAGKSLFYAVSNTMERGMDTIRVIKDTAYANGNVRNHFHFREVLRKSKNLAWAWKYYPEDNHSSVPLPSQYDALRQLFKKYEMGKELGDSTITVEYIRDHYRAVSAMLQYPVAPSEGTVNILGYTALGNKQYGKAYEFFNMNIDNYPTSANAFDSMGDYYLERGDKEKAMEAFRKALSLEEVAETRKKLEMLQAKE
ncbi:alpha/beta hydrolase-fold protein [Rufibacter hautae]|uniref:Alpha/beta hydrolase n=1 Tax=Rufibacter hautae TaxID=2595005 RepID=A0A5B6TAZ9_9BACT|nr:alpha/beta hydrolase-fold protein [Rufibacter hautae]KAA3437105.1 alpha/beta hydrolase [Rufibacter hautae]